MLYRSIIISQIAETVYSAFSGIERASDGSIERALVREYAEQESRQEPEYVSAEAPAHIAPLLRQPRLPAASAAGYEAVDAKDEIASVPMGDHPYCFDVSRVSSHSVDLPDRSSDGFDAALAKFEKDGSLPDDFELRKKIVNAKYQSDKGNKPAWHK